MSRVLTLNAGSSSIKFALYGEGGSETPLVKGQVVFGITENVLQVGGEADMPFQAAGGHAPVALLEHLRARPGFDGIAAIGHRIVHGGRDFERPVRLTEDVMSKLRALVPLAPLHQPHNLAGIAAASAIWPEAVQIGAFDTAFHYTQPRVAGIYALPPEYEARGLIRYGFHGLSYQYVAEELRRRDGGIPERTIVAHLGAGCSMAALRNGRSIATSMGFTALDGLPMATRSGRVDPGLILHLIGHEGMSAAELGDLLYRKSGLAGLSGTTGDMRALAASDAPDARFARDYFAYCCRMEIGALAAALGGCDALVFTGGVGANDTAIRADIMHGLDWLCVPTVLAMPTDEERVIAEGCAALLGEVNG
ncbi:acetate kinase [Pacificimonas sp. WHA3]|uniref:Acetate kinase n=1 Tax=Pacificimonas pallii TaxID=2827236 RepID=A0ABS6SDX3_9SPHN|nr:acetate kinase [Pacificimonas pallii]MBV7256610.1 acetate kinase [Pacificimonas pallii]